MLTRGELYKELRVFCNPCSDPISIIRKDFLLVFLDIMGHAMMWAFRRHLACVASSGVVAILSLRKKLMTKMRILHNLQKETAGCWLTQHPLIIAFLIAGDFCLNPDFVLESERKSNKQGASFLAFLYKTSGEIFFSILKLKIYLSL